MNAIDSFINKRVVSAKDFMDINKAYKKVIDKINPLLNTNSEAETDLYIKVLEAFSNYDLDFVLSVSNMLDNSLCNYFLFTNNMLYTEKLRLEKLMEEIVSTTEKIKGSYPWSLERFLIDKKLYNKRNQILNKRIASLELAIRGLEEDIKTKLEFYNER